MLMVVLKRTVCYFVFSVFRIVCSAVEAGGGGKQLGLKEDITIQYWSLCWTLPRLIKLFTDFRMNHNIEFTFELIGFLLSFIIRVTHLKKIKFQHIGRAIGVCNTAFESYGQYKIFVIGFFQSVQPNWHNCNFYGTTWKFWMRTWMI